MNSSGAIPEIDPETDNLATVQQWLSQVEVWLVEHIDCRFTARAQIEAKCMREVLRIMRPFWEIIQSDPTKLFVVVHSFEVRDGKTIKLSPDEVLIREREERKKKLDKASKDYERWVPTLHLRIEMLAAYVRKIQEATKPKDGSSENLFEFAGTFTDFESYCIYSADRKKFQKLSNTKKRYLWELLANTYEKEPVEIPEGEKFIAEKLERAGVHITKSDFDGLIGTLASLSPLSREKIAALILRKPKIGLKKTH